MPLDPAWAPVPGAAVIWCAGVHTLVRPEQTRRFGRGEDNDIRIGPSDVLVSREAGLLAGETDGVLVRNLSQTRPIRYQAYGGPDLQIGPGMVVGTMPFPMVHLQLYGEYGVVHSLHVDARGLSLRSPFSAERSGKDTGAQRIDHSITKFTPTGKLTGRDLLLLAALCEPLLVGVGGRPRTYAEIAERLGGTATANSVRTGLDRVREKLSNDGIPGLRRAEGEPAVRNTTRYVEALARWAVDTGHIDRATVERLLP